MIHKFQVEGGIQNNQNMEQKEKSKNTQGSQRLWSSFFPEEEILK